MGIRHFTSIALAICALAPLTPSFGEETGGREMYLKYCASCHGSQGKGDGPVSRDLKIKATDLTLLLSKNNVVYPLNRVMAAIDGSQTVLGHGTRAMPVLGEFFRVEHEKQKYTELTSLLKAKVIAEYVGTLQK